VLALRVALSLGVVLALLWVLQKRVARGRGGLLGTRRESTVTVVARQGVGAKASVVVVDVEGERLVLGVTDGGISVLAAAPTASDASVAVPEAPVTEQPADPFAAVLAAQPGAVATSAPVAASPVLAPVAASPVLAPVLAPVAPAGPADALPLRPRGAARRSAVRGARPAAGAVAGPVAGRVARLDPALRARGRAATALDGSILSPDTWRQAAAALRSRRAG